VLVSSITRSTARVQSVNLDVIENSGPDNLRDMLRAECKRATDVAVGVAFVTQSGLDDILQTLRQVAVGGRVRLLTGLYQKVSEPQALKTLLRVQEETRGQFSVRLSTEPQYHRKVYILRGKSNTAVIVGSSNLTREGLRSGGELNVVVRFPKGALAGKKLTGAFEDDWKHHAVPLAAEQIVEYEKVRPRPPAWEGYRKGQLEQILGAAPSHQQAADDDTHGDMWRDCVTGTVRRKTERVISETTDWDEKDYSWFSTDGTHAYEIGDGIFLFDFADKRVRLVRVRGKSHTTVPTPDGRHFVAYTAVPRVTRLFSQQLWLALADENIDRKKAHSRRKMSEAQADRLDAIIRTRSK
jgi:HKD family nuclease